MAAQLIDGKALAAKVRGEVAQRVSALVARGVTPGLAVVLVGEDPASQIYVRSKERACAKTGIRAMDHRLAADTSQADLMELIGELNADSEVHGILVQLPLPSHLDASDVQDAISPRKDVDGLHPQNLGLLAQRRPGFVPCTPNGCMRMLASLSPGDGATGGEGYDLTGKRALVIGRSNLVGRPMMMLLANANATVTGCHSRTVNLREEVMRADVVVAAVGIAKLVKSDWIKEGAVVLDVGMNRDEDGKLCGDVDFDAVRERASAITPVPGGVGPMTIAGLLENTVLSAERCADAIG